MKKYTLQGDPTCLLSYTYMPDPKPEKTAGVMAKRSWSIELPL